MRTRHNNGRWQVGELSAGLITALLLVPAVLVGQTAAGIPTARDLQGVWDFRSAIPFERPDELVGKETLSPKEAAVFEQERVDAQNVDLRRDENGKLPVSGGYNNFWYDRGTSIGDDRRTALVVETRNFNGQTSFRNSSEEMRLVERFTRVDEGTLRYEYTVTDPESFERPWSVRVDMQRSDSQVFEYACHEGNYGMENLLVSARARDQQ